MYWYYVYIYIYNYIYIYVYIHICTAYCFIMFDRGQTLKWTVVGWNEGDLDMLWLFFWLSCPCFDPALDPSSQCSIPHHLPIVLGLSSDHSRFNIFKLLLNAYFCCDQKLLRPNAVLWSSVGAHLWPQEPRPRSCTLCPVGHMRPDTSWTWDSRWIRSCLRSPRTGLVGQNRLGNLSNFAIDITLNQDLKGSISIAPSSSWLIGLLYFTYTYIHMYRGQILMMLMVYYLPPQKPMQLFSRR